MFGLMIAWHRDVDAMIKEFLLNPPFERKDNFCWCEGVGVILWVLWGKQNKRVLRGMDWDPTAICLFSPSSVFMFLFGLQYPIGILLHSWSPFL